MVTTTDSGFRILEHPSDVGIEAWGATISDAFRQAVGGLVSVIAEPGGIRPSVSAMIEIQAGDPAQLLVRLLSEVLFRFDAERFLTSRLVIRAMSGTGLSGDLLGEPVDPARHILKLDVKAVTYHQLSVSEEGGLVRVRVFLDI